MANPEVVAQTEALFARMAASGRPILIGGPANNIQINDGQIVGVSKQPSLPDYVVEAALKHGAIDQRFPATDFIMKSRNGALDQINKQLDLIRASTATEPKLQVVSGPSTTA